MKTKLQKLKDFDFKVTLSATIVIGIFVIILLAITLYTPYVYYWPLYMVAGAAFMLLLWKVVLQYLIVKYQDE